VSYFLNQTLQKRLHSNPEIIPSTFFLKKKNLISIGWITPKNYTSVNYRLKMGKMYTLQGIKSQYIIIQQAEIDLLSKKRNMILPRNLSVKLQAQGLLSFCVGQKLTCMC